MAFTKHDLSPERRAGNSATYCPEDNKLRLYCGRVDRETYEELRRLKFVSTPKQDCDFVVTWSPQAEDAILDLLPDGDDIGDEDYSPEERAADRAERFAAYRDKRRTEAHGHADTYDAGPSAFGYQNARRAERAAARHERHRGLALSQWSKSEYWQERTAAVIGHALHKSSARVRRGRILEIEKEIRRIQSIYTPNPSMEETTQQNDAGETVTVVWCGPTRGGWWREKAKLPQIEARYRRTLEHLRMRLIYENAMLENEGGMVAAVEIEPGGWFGECQVQKVNRSPKTGRVVSVLVYGKWGYTSIGGRRVYLDHENPEGLARMNVERLPEDAYRPPTDEERAEFVARQATAKAKAKASKPKAPALLNPTDEDAQRLQDRLNALRKAAHDARNHYREFEPDEVLRMTQAQYSQLSKGTYTKAETRTLHDCGRLARKRSNMYSSEGTAYDKSLGAAVCKLRTYGYPARVVVLTDKPQKPLPIDWEAVESRELETVAS